MNTNGLKVKNGNNPFFYACLVASMFIIQGAPTQVTPHIAAFSEMFSDHALTSVMYLATIPNLVCVPASFIVGWFVKKIGLKNSLLMGVISFLVGGFLPLINPHTFGWLIFCRFIAGWGYGTLYSLAVTLVSALYEEGQLRQTMMGVGTAFQLIGVMAFSYGTGFMVSVMSDISGLWIATVLMVPALVLTIFAKIPSEDAEAKLAEAEAAKQEAKQAAKAAAAEGKPLAKKEKLNGYVWFYLLTMFVVGLVLNEEFIYLSNVIVDNGFGTATDVAGVVSAHALVAAIVSFVYGLMYKGIGKRMTLVVSTVICILGNFLMANAHGLIAMYIGACLHHAGFGWMFSAICMLLAQVTPPGKLSLINGWMVAIFNLGAFCTGNVMIWLTQILGRPNDLQFAFMIGGVIYIALAIAYFVIKPKIDYTKEEGTAASAE